MASVPPGGKPVEVKPGQLMTGMSADTAGIANYTIKRNFRRVLERDVRAEGYDGLRFNPRMDRGIQSVPTEAKQKFRNQVVYFNNLCPNGYDPSLGAPIPDWVIFDHDHNRFKVPAGIFSGLSQAEADQNAQDALNEFGSAALVNGTVICTLIPPPVTEPDLIILPDDEQVGD